MQPETIICDNRTVEGAPCGRRALVHMIHYVYRTERTPGHSSLTHVLLEADYDIECPRCGHRTQTVKA
jgi:hypothetical protein